MVAGWWWGLFPVAIIGLGAAANATAFLLARGIRPQQVEPSVWLALRDEETRLAAVRRGAASGATISLRGTAQRAVLSIEGLSDAAGAVDLIRLDDAGRDRRLPWASASRAIDLDGLPRGRWNVRWRSADQATILESRSIIAAE